VQNPGRLGEILDNLEQTASDVYKK